MDHLMKKTMKNFRVTPEFAERLESAAKQTDQTQTAFIKDAIVAKVEKIERKHKLDNPIPRLDT